MSDTLLLNSDAQPVSWLPLSTLTWQDAIKTMVLEKARVLEWHDEWTIASERWETKVPSVMMLTEYMKPKRRVKFSKSVVFLRDMYACAYCSKKLTMKECTLDHVLPSSLGGKTTFENCITACGPCNSRKGNNSKVIPKRNPHKPDYYELVNNHKKSIHGVKYKQWVEYLVY